MTGRRQHDQERVGASGGFSNRHVMPPPLIERRNLSLNLNVRGLGHSPTLAINDQVRRLRRSGQDIYNFGLGESPFPIPQHVVETLQHNASRKQYLPVEGLEELRQAVSGFMARTQNVRVDPEDVLVGPGSKELLFLLQLCFYGDIIVPNPCWVSYTPQAQMLSRKVRYVDTSLEDGWKVSPERLAGVLAEEEDRYRPRLFVLNYPANPTGVSYTAGELQALAKVLREYEVLVLSDEIYSGLHHDGSHVSIARYYPEGTIVLNGISKWPGAGGWRLGVFAFCKSLDWLREAMAAVASETYTSVCTPVQYAAVEAFEGGIGLERRLAHQRRILRAAVGHAYEALRDAGVELVRPDGAYYMFPDFTPLRRRFSRRGIKGSQDMCQHILDETGVAMLPGRAFARPKDEFTARMSLVDFDGSQALAASEGVPLDQELPDEFLARNMEHQVEGIERLVEWLGRRS